MKKRILSLMLSVLIIVSISCTLSVSANQYVRVFLDGKQLNFDVQAQIINDRTMVPLRAIFESLGASVDWNGDTQTVTSTKDDISITLTIDNPIMHINDSAVTLDSPACLVDNRTLVPVRAVSEAFGIEVEWNAISKCVNLFSKYKESDWDKSSLLNSGDYGKELTMEILKYDAMLTLKFEDDYLIYECKSNKECIYGIDINLYYNMTFNEKGWIDDFENARFGNPKVTAFNETPQKEKAVKIPLNEIPDGARIQPYVDFVNEDEYIEINGEKIKVRNDRRNYFCDGLNDKYPIYVDVFSKTFKQNPTPVWQHNKDLLLEWKNPANYLGLNIDEDVVNLSNQICKDAVDEYDKVRKINEWVYKNIEYNFDYFYGKTDKCSFEPSDIITHKTTVCEGYANLTRALIQAQDIPCQKVIGYALGIDTKGLWDDSNINITNSNHAWNRAYINNRWINIESTWDSNNGYEKYFDMPDFKFASTHKVLSIN